MNDRVNSFSKEVIKVRMLQNAVKIWGLKSVSSVDPFVSLLIDAFATEIFKASNEIQASNSRVLEKLAKLLTPSVYTYPQPAHAIAHTYPVDATEVLPAYSEFFIKKQVPSSIKSISDEEIDIHFTPVDDVQLIKMDIALMVTAHTGYYFDKDKNKLPLARINASSIPHNRILLGIDASAYTAFTAPSRLALYCANPTFEYVDFVYSLLPFVDMSSAGKPLTVTEGLTYVGNTNTEGYEAIFREYAMQKRLEENVKNNYKNKFIELSGFPADVITTELPESLAFIPAYPELHAVVKDKKMIWVAMDFPPQYNMEILENFSFSLNAFPIYNRKWKNNEYTLDIMGDNVPLSTAIGEHFLYVDKVEDSFGNSYQEIPFQRNVDRNDKGLFTIRKGGMERFNERNALELIANVLELTRDEVSAFGVLGRDKVVEALAAMTSQMRVLDQRITNAERSVIQEINYVIVNPYDNIEHLNASYWVTHCSLANAERSGTILRQPKVTGLNVHQFIQLLTPTVGGHEAQKGTNAIQAYKYALTSRDKLISIEDIKNYCAMELRDDLKSVAIKRGTIISSKPKEGFIKTIEVEITPTSYAHYGKKYWDNLSVTLKHKIRHRGIDGIEYVVVVNNGDDE